MYVIKFSNSYVVALCLCSKFLIFTGNFPSLLVYATFEARNLLGIINKLVPVNLMTSCLEFR
jgi:hypothetical protein